MGQVKLPLLVFIADWQYYRDRLVAVTLSTVNVVKVQGLRKGD